MLGLGSTLTYMQGLFGGFINATATAFDGANDKANTGSGASAPSELTVNASGADRGCSISFWVRLNTANSEQIIGRANAWQGAPASSYYSEFIIFTRYNRKLVMGLYGANGSGAMDGTVHMVLDKTDILSDDTWYHVVYTYDLGSGTGSLIGYLDGTKFEHGDGGTNVITGTWAVPNPSGAPSGINLSVGCPNNGTTFGEFDMDELAFFDEVLTQSQVNDLYGDGTPGDAAVISSNVTGLWRMGDGDTFPTITDHSGNGNDLTMTNMASDDFITGKT